MVGRVLRSKEGILSKEDVLDYFRNYNITDHCFSFNKDYVNRIHPILDYCIRSKVISKEEFVDSVEDAIEKIARTDYNRLLKSSLTIYPDELEHNLLSNRVFAYAIKNKFSKKEIRKIPLGECDETIEKYVNHYNSGNILNDWVYGFLNPRPHSEFDVSGDCDCCCMCD